MKIIVSLNGLDGSDKFTLIELLKNNSPNLIEKIDDIENFAPFNQYNGDLLKTSPEEYVNIMYKSISNRNEKIKLSNKPIIIINKGIINYDTIILSNLLIKSLNEEKSLELINNKKKELNIEDIEDFQIIFMNKKTINKNNNEIYQKYLEEQIEKISTIKDPRIIKFNSKDNADETSNNLNELIYNLLKTKLTIPFNKAIFGIEGLSESGKKRIDIYLANEFNVWNLKLNYFNYEICNRYNIKSEDLNLNDKKYISILEAEEIINFLNINNSQRIITIQSQNSYPYFLYLKDILNNIFKIIFINTNENEIPSNKDNIQIQEIEKIKNFSDFIVDNTLIKEQLMTQLDHIITQMDIQKNISIKDINQFNIPLKYKQLLEQLYKEILNSFDVKLFIVHGSCSTETVIEDYSDIDLILVIEPNDISTRKLMNEIIQKNNNGIKVGTTIYTKKEFESLQVDFKTLYCIYKINNKENYPMFISDINIPIVNKYTMIQQVKYLIPSKIHELRRILYNPESKKIDDIFKNLTHLMKNFLFIEEIEYDKGYYDLCKTFSKTYKLEEFNVDKYFKEENYKKELINYCNYVIDKLNIVYESTNKKRKSARGIILKDDNIILIHRIKENKEYYVYPGGGVEEGETNEQCVSREIKQELGIEIKILKYLYRLEEEKSIEYYFLCEYLSGEIGSGSGPEFNDEKYINNGKYIPEIHKINDINKLDLKKIITNNILQDIERYNSLNDIPFKNIINI